MKLLKEKIIKDGDIINGQIIKVDSFLNHQIDVDMLNEIGKEFYNRYEGQKVDKILTIEASGIAKAVIAVILTLMSGYLGIVAGINMNLPEMGSIAAITVMGACIIFYNEQKNNI